ncbi:MAG: response regulator [Myxococcota bacterium]|nr:response regulator [Myxococcota bacterium]
MSHESETQNVRVVLVIDDDALSRRLLVRILSREGFDVREAEDGPSALTLLEDPDNSFCAIVSDMLMPAMSGERLAEILEGSYSEIPTLFVSGLARDHFPKLSNNSNHAFLQKPFRPSDFVSAFDDIFVKEPR